MSEMTPEEKVQKIRKIAKGLTDEDKKDPVIKDKLKFFKPLLEGN